MNSSCTMLKFLHVYLNLDRLWLNTFCCLARYSWCFLIVLMMRLQAWNFIFERARPFSFGKGQEQGQRRPCPETICPLKPYLGAGFGLLVLSALHPFEAPYKSTRFQNTFQSCKPCFLIGLTTQIGYSVQISDLKTTKPTLFTIRMFYESERQRKRSLNDQNKDNLNPNTGVLIYRWKYCHLKFLGGKLIG